MAISGADEIYRKLSSQIASQFPEHLREDAPRFIAFLKAYFEYLEQSQKAGDAARGLYDYMDIDRTLDDFVEHFQRQFMENIPTSILADKRLLSKYISQFYQARGSEESYRFLFRAMFDEEIDLYYPGDDILRASDGRWVQETVVRGIVVSGVPEDMAGKQVTGSVSGVTARAQEVLRIRALGIDLIQIIVENATGTFEEDELVEDDYGNKIKVFGAVGSLQGVIIDEPGAFHSAGDTVSLSGAGGGIANGTIRSTTDVSAVTFRIQNGGSGYRLDGNTTLTVSGGNPTIPAQLRIMNLSNTATTNTCTTTIAVAADVTLDTQPFNVGSGNFPTSNVNSTLADALSFADITTGSINTIALIYPGYGYGQELPTVTALDSEIYNGLEYDSDKGGYKGFNAVIIASRAYGAISSVRINSSDLAFQKNDTITITNATTPTANVTDTSVDAISGQTRGLRRQGTYGATVTANIQGSFPLSGRYIDTKGFLSWNNKLQDNDFYQEFSYVIRARKLLKDYQAIVKESVHPSGTKMFGMLMNDTGVDFSTYTANVGSAAIVYTLAHSNNVIAITGDPKRSVRITVPPLWANNGTLKANTGSISVSGTGSNLMIIPVSNTSAANGLYQVNTISSNSQFTLRNAWEHGALSNGYFYYQSSYTGDV